MKSKQVDEEEDRVCKCGHKEYYHSGAGCWGTAYSRDYFCSCKGFEEENGAEEDE